MCQNYLAIFLSIHISFQGNQNFFEPDKNVLRQTSSKRKMLFSLAALEVISHLSSLAKKKKMLLG